MTETDADVDTDSDAADTDEDTLNTDVDTARLESYLAEELGVDVARTEELSDKINLIVKISTEEGEDYVLRRPNGVRHTDLFNDLSREYELLRRLKETSIPVQSPVAYCDDDSVVGDSFSVTTYLDGESVPLGSDLPERFRNAESRRTVADRLIDTLADIHSLDAESFEGVCRYRTARERVARATDRLDRATSVTGHELATLRSVGDWLERNAPTDSETTLVHGDFRPSNVLFAGTDRPEITGVLDWETAMLGDPLTEVGYLLLRWRDDGDPTLPLDELEGRYSDGDAIRQLREINENGLAPFTSKPGSPSRRELVARYEEQTGISFENERFYRAHSAFTLATVWEDIYRHRTAAGAESGLKPLIDYMSMVADGIVSGEYPL